MATDVSICSNALLLLGDNPITDFADGSDRATLASNLWPTVRDDMIRAYTWSSCIKRVQLTHNNTAPVFGFTYAFNIPGDCLRVLSIEPYEYPLTHKVEGQQILSNYTPMYLRYLFRNQTVTSWDAGLVDVMTIAMTAAMAYPITKSLDVKAAFEKQLFVKLRGVRAADSQQSTHPGILSSPLTECRGI
jgi:hypothetical protein